MKITDKMRLDFIENKKDWVLDAEWGYLGMKKCWSFGEPERVAEWFPKLRQAIDATIRSSKARGGKS